LTGLSEFLRKI